jgi:hypothetical protein
VRVDVHKLLNKFIRVKLVGQDVPVRFSLLPSHFAVNSDSLTELEHVLQCKCVAQASAKLHGFLIACFRASSYTATSAGGFSRPSYGYCFGVELLYLYVLDMAVATWAVQ